MKTAFILKESKKVVKILNETYDDLLAAVKNRNPDAENLIEDEELFQLHDILVLLRLGYLKTYGVESHDGQTLKIFEIDSTRILLRT